MEKIINTKLEIQVFKYRSKEEMDSHRRQMMMNGWNCKYNGQCNLSPETTMSAHFDDSNWYYVAEYYKHKEEKTSKPVSYHSDGYFVSVFNPNKQEVTV